MDFLKILRSFEDFLFEAASWLVFYPLTLWRIIRRPLYTLEYSDREQAASEERRYDDALSPPLLLLATVVLANLVATAAHAPPPQETSEMLRGIVNSRQNLVLFRSLMFSLIPLVSAVSLLHHQGMHISRRTLKAPFYAQCYLAAPCAAFISAGTVILQRPDMPNALGWGIMAGGAIWFLTIQTIWFSRKLNKPLAQAALSATWAAVRAMAYLVTIALPVALI